MRFFFSTYNPCIKRANRWYLTFLLLLLVIFSLLGCFVSFLLFIYLVTIIKLCFFLYELHIFLIGYLNNVQPRSNREKQNKGSRSQAKSYKSKYVSILTFPYLCRRKFLGPRLSCYGCQKL